MTGQPRQGLAGSPPYPGLTWQGIATHLWYGSATTVRLDLVGNYLFVALALFCTFSTAAADLALFLLLITVLMGGGYRKKLLHLARSPVAVACTGIIFLTVVGLLWTEDVGAGLYFLDRAKYLLLVLFAVAVVSPAFSGRILGAFMVSVLFSVFCSYLIFLQVIPPDFFGADFTMGRGWRDPAPFSHHVIFSLILAVAAPLFLFRFLHAQVRKWKVAYGVAFLLLTMDLFLTAGRTGQLAYMLTVGVILIWHSRRARLVVAISLLVAVAGIVVSFQLSDLPGRRAERTLAELALISEGTLESSLGQRIKGVLVGVKTGLEHPILGVGTGDAMAAAQAKTREMFPAAPELQLDRHLHNQFIHSFVQHGVLGLAAILLLYWGVFFPPRGAGPLLVTVGVAYLIAGFSLMWTTDRLLAVVFAVLYGAYTHLASPGQVAAWCRMHDEAGARHPDVHGKGSNGSLL